MPRIAKSDVSAALSTVAKALITASGSDGRTSRADLKAALKILPREQRPLADIFFRFVDHRDFKAGAQVTAKDINKAVAYAKTHMIAKYDLNSNGLSKTEISRMSLTGKLAVDLARALKSAAKADTFGKLSTKALEVEVNKYAAKANYMSESDYSPEFVSGELPAGHELTDRNAISSLSAPLSRLFEGSETPFPGGYTAEAYSAVDAKAFIEDLRTANRDEGENTESVAAFGFITRALQANLTDIKVYKIGPREENGSGLATDQGLYAQVIVGRTADGKIAGIIIGDVET